MAVVTPTGKRTKVQLFLWFHFFVRSFDGTFVGFASSSLLSWVNVTLTHLSCKKCGQGKVKGEGNGEQEHYGKISFLFFCSLAFHLFQRKSLEGAWKSFQVNFLIPFFIYSLLLLRFSSTEVEIPVAWRVSVEYNWTNSPSTHLISSTIHDDPLPLLQF